MRRWAAQPAVTSILDDTELSGHLGDTDGLELRGIPACLLAECPAVAGQESQDVS